MNFEPEAFWELVGLEPTVDDEPTLRAAIDRKAKEATKRTNDPPGDSRFNAERFLEEKARIEQTLLDPAQRRALRPAALARQKKRRDELRAQLREALRLHTLPDGSLPAAALQKLKERFVKQGLAEADVMSEVKAPVRNETPAKPPPSLPSGWMDEIEACLKQVGKDDLYDFLGLGARASDAALLARTREIERSPEVTQPRKTVRVTAAGKLVGKCSDIFRSPEKRAAYDHALSLAGLAKVREEFNHFHNPEVTPEVYDHLLAVGRKAGADDEAIVAEITRLAKAQGKLVRSAAPKGDERRCGACGATTPGAAKACRDCGSPLVLACPGCRAETPSVDRSCRHCGFPVGDVPYLDARLADANALLAKGDLAGAEGVLQEVEGVLGAQRSYDGTRRARDALRDARAREAATRDELTRLVDARRHHEALSKLDALAPKGGAGSLAALRAGCEQAIRKAEAEVGSARAAEARGDASAAFRHLVAALALVADHPPARDLLASLPLPAPDRVDLRITSVADVSWSPAQAPGQLSYLVVRKPQAAPTGPRDGVPIGTVQTTRITDPSPPPGVPCYYAVFTLREGVPSTGRVAGPVMALGDVEGLEADCGDGWVSLAWRLPPGARDVEVFRAEGAHPPTPTRENRRPTPARGGLRDEAVRNGATYTYLIRATAVLPDATTKTSEGLVRTLTPRAAGTPIEDLTARREGTRVHLAWTQPPGATVRILRVPPSWTPRAGDRVPLDALAIGTRLVAQGQIGHATDEIDTERVVRYVPVLEEGRRGIVGRAVRVVALDEVQGLRASVTGSSILLTWSWPVGVQVCHVAMRRDAFAEGPHDPRSTWERVPRASFESAGRYRLSISQGTRVMHVSVHSSCRDGGEELLGTASDAGSRLRIDIESRG